MSVILKNLVSWDVVSYRLETAVQVATELEEEEWREMLKEKREDAARAEALCEDAIFEFEKKEEEEEDSELSEEDEDLVKDFTWDSWCVKRWTEKLREKAREEKARDEKRKTK